MPTPAPSSAAAPAAVPVTPAAPATPTTPPVATPTTPPADTKAAGRGSRIFKLLADEQAPKPEEKKETVAPPAKETKTPETPAPVTPEKPIKAVKKAAIAKRPEPAAPIAPPVPEPTPKPAAKDDTDWEAGLVDEEKQLIADAAEAEQHLPARKGLKEQAKKFVREHQKYLDDHPDIEDDPEQKAGYEKWLAKNRPALSEAEQRTVSEGRIAARVQKPWEEKYSTLEHEIFVRDREPEIKQKATNVESQLNSTVIPKEIMDFAEKHGVEEAKKHFVDELGAVRAVVSAASADYAELVRLGTVNPKTGKPLVAPAKDASDPRFEQHSRLDEIIRKVGDEFKDSASQKELVRDGKWFCTRDEWNAGFHRFPNQYWTFNNEEVAQRMLPWAKNGVEQAIAQNRQAMEQRGYERRQFVPKTPPAVPATPTAPPPGPGASPAPGASPVTPPAQNTIGHRLSSALTKA